MPTIQEWIHSLEEGAGARLMRRVTVVLGLIALATLYNFRAYKNFDNPEAMDTAQVARNLAEGNGFTTRFIRPASMHFVRQQTGQNHLDGLHPDIANAPLYPFILSLWMRVIPFDFDIREPAQFHTYQPELRIAWLNQALLALTVLLAWRLATRLFDPFVGWLTAGVLAGTDWLWQHSISGLPTCLLLALIVALATILCRASSWLEEDETRGGRLVGMAAVAGGLAGMLFLTRYGLFWLFIPVLVYFNTCFRTRGFALGIIALLAFGITIAPWMIRNHQLSGSILGTAGLTALERTFRFPDARVQRLVQPENVDSPDDIGKVGLGEYWAKLDANLPGILQNDLPRLGGNWIVAFFLVGLMVPFQRAVLSQLRWWLLGAIVVTVIVQALSRSHFGELVDGPDGDDLLVLWLPLVAMFGAALFSALVDQIRLEGPNATRVLGTVFVIVLSLPLLVSVFNGRPSPWSYPPYHPPIIQERAGWMGERELMMSDMPWAVAWYGRRDCVWLPGQFTAGLAAIYRQRPVQAIYLTALTLDQKLVTGMLQSPDPDWGRFAADAVVKEEIPPGFPLKHAFAEGFPFQLLLSDRPRWQTAESPGK